MEASLDIVGSLFTAFSVLFAIFVYIRNRDADASAALRTSLIEMKMALELFMQATSEEAFSEIGVSISKQLRAIYPNGCTPEQVIDLLTTEENNYWITAVYLGVQQSKTLEIAGLRAEKLNEIPLQYETNAPLISEVLKGCLFYLAESLRIVASTRQYVGIHRDNMAYVEERLNKIEDVDLLFREIAEMFYEYSASVAKEQNVYEVANAAKSIIEIFSRNILTRSDAELRRIRRHNLQIYRTKPLPTDAETAIDRAFFYLEQIKSDFSTHDWNQMFEDKMTIDRLAYPKTAT